MSWTPERRKAASIRAKTHRPWESRKPPAKCAKCGGRSIIRRSGVVGYRYCEDCGNGEKA